MSSTRTARSSPRSGAPFSCLAASRAKRSRSSANAPLGAAFGGTLGHERRDAFACDERGCEVDDLEGTGHGEGGHMVSSEVAERVRAVISAAEAAASALRHEAEQDAQMRRRATEEEARHYLEDARRDAEAFLRERQRRIAELSDEILERSEQILARLDRAEDVKRQLQELADALGATAQQIATGVGGRGARVAPEPEPEPEPEPAPAPVAEEPPIVETEPVPEPDEGDVEVVELPRTEEA